MGTKLFCAYMKEERERQGYSIDDLAKKLNTSVKHVTMLEDAGRNFVAVSHISQIAAGFDMTTEQLINWVKNKMTENTSLENEIGPYMRSLCYEKKIHIKDVAEKAGMVEYDLFSFMLNNKKFSYLDFIDRWVAVLRLSLPELLDVLGEQDPPEDS